MRDFSKVSPTLWRSRKFKALTDETAKLAYLYLLTCPHGNSAGCFDLPTMYACADLDIKEAAYLKALDALIKVGLVEYDQDDETVLLVNWATFNVPTNAKHAMGLLDQLDQASSISLKSAALKDFQKAIHAKGFDEVEALAKAMDRLSIAYLEAMERVSPPRPDQTETRDQTERETDAPQALAPSDVQLCVDAWNMLAGECDLPLVQAITPGRTTALKARLAECGGVEGFAYALTKVRASPFLLGANDRGWRADFDFLLQRKSFTKLMEGKYDDRKPTGASSKPTLANSADQARAIIAEAVRRERAASRTEGDGTAEPLA